jgi:hypothetical protein
MLRNWVVSSSLGKDEISHRHKLSDSSWSKNTMKILIPTKSAVLPSSEERWEKFTSRAYRSWKIQKAHHSIFWISISLHLLLSWGPECRLIDEEPAPSQASKIRRDTLDPEKYTAFYVKQNCAYIEKHFHPIVPGEAPGNVKAPAKAPNLNPVVFLVNNTCSMLHAGVTEHNEPIFEWQYSRICMEWLRLVNTFFKCQSQLQCKT